LEKTTDSRVNIQQSSKYE